jgi:hypothetical protein
MRKYDKIETIFSRDMTGTKKLIPGVFRDPTVEFLRVNKWIWTEKVDGTNIRVYWDGHTVSFGGRTDNATIPADNANPQYIVKNTNNANSHFLPTARLLYTLVLLNPYSGKRDNMEVFVCSMIIIVYIYSKSN